MSHTLRHIVDDISKDLKQNFDDKKIQSSQVAYWVTIVADRLRMQHIAKRSSGAFLNTFVDVPIEVSSVNENPNLIKGRKYLKLPGCIYDFDKDEGIDYISYYLEEDCEGVPPFTQIIFQRTTPSKARRLYFSPYEEPSAKNPYFYRSGEFIYLLGVECVPVKKIEIGLFMTLPPITEVKLDDPFDFPPELLAILKRQVLDLGRWSLLIPEERLNDGSDSTNENRVPTGKIVSVNELNQETPVNKKE